MKTVIEPFRIKSIEAINMTTKAERKHFIEKAYYNVTLLRSDEVLIDFLTDSGTSAMSSIQWASMQTADESYVRSTSFYEFKKSVQDLTSFKHIIPTHQGRAAERILATVISNENSLIPSNSHFDTTRANFETMGAVADDYVIEEANNFLSEYPFKGNIDLDKLRKLLKTSHENIPLVMMTITNNTAHGQPVSMENIRETSKLCKLYKIPLFFDGCRFIENAYFIKLRESGYSNFNVVEIIKEMFSYADGMTMSGKKDALVNTGGWLALNDDSLAIKSMDELLRTEGFVTYGGLAGRDLAAMAVGLREGLNEDYLKYRICSTQYLGLALEKLGIPVLKPFGAHAIYIDVKSMLPHIREELYPGQALSVALYIEAGLRVCEVSSIKLDMVSKENKTSDKILVRLAIPRRVYTKSHLDYVIEAFENINVAKSSLDGYKMTHQSCALRDYGAKFKPVTE